VRRTVNIGLDTVLRFTREYGYKYTERESDLGRVAQVVYGDGVVTFEPMEKNQYIMSMDNESSRASRIVYGNFWAWWRPVVGEINP